MRAGCDRAVLTAEQEQAAAAGRKALMPVGGGVLLDHAISRLARTGVRRVALVHAPGDEALATWTPAPAVSDVEVVPCLQARPRGTADALLAGQPGLEPGPFLAVNSDNLYPVSALQALARLEGQGVLAVERSRVAADDGSNLTQQRLAQYALIALDHHGELEALREKPGWEEYRTLVDPVLSSVNAWRFAPSIFEHCRAVEESPRGELELPSAVERAIAAGEGFSVVVADAGVLDLSMRRDVAMVEARLLEELG